LRRGRQQLEFATDGGNAILRQPDDVLHLVGALGCLPREVADIGGNDGETAPELTRARSLDRPAHRKHICLDRNQSDAIDNLLDATARLVEGGHHGDDGDTFLNRVRDTFTQLGYVHATCFK
jgi:hypothetical protein